MNVNSLWEEGLSVGGSSPTEVGAAAQLFHTLEDQETETYLASGPHPEVESPSRPVPRNSLLPARLQSQVLPPN